MKATVAVIGPPVEAKLQLLLDPLPTSKLAHAPPTGAEIVVDSASSLFAMFGSG